MTSPATIAQLALQALIQGLQTGQWLPLRDRLSEDVTLWFPKESFQGVNRGQDRTIALLQSIQWDAETAITVEQVTCNGTTVVFELRLDQPTGCQPGFERAAIAFQVRGNQVSAMHSYLLLYHPAQP